VCAGICSGNALIFPFTMNKPPIKLQAEALAQQLQPEFPVLAAMLQKNLRRYLAVLQFVSDQLHPDGQTRILDYGCGYPLLVKLLRDGGLAATGYEPYAEESYHALAAKLGIAPHFFTTLPPGDQFDVVTLVDVIEHLSILRPTMTDVIARIRPGGYLVISTPNGLRLSQWLAFVRRKTAHPVAIEKFLKTDNNYVHHQREFTRPELEKTMRYYGLEVVTSTCVDTMPQRGDLEKYHVLLGQPKELISWRTRLRDGLQSRLPADWQNNLLLLARKPAAPPSL